MVKVDCGFAESEFEFQSCYYVHFQNNTLEKGRNPLILQLCVKWYHCCSLIRMALALNNPQRLICIQQSNLNLTTIFGLLLFIFPSFCIAKFQNRSSFVFCYWFWLVFNTIVHNPIFHSINIFPNVYNVLFYHAFLYILKALRLGNRTLRGHLIYLFLLFDRLSLFLSVVELVCKFITFFAYWIFLHLLLMRVY